MEDIPAGEKLLCALGSGKAELPCRVGRFCRNRRSGMQLCSTYSDSLFDAWVEGLLKSPKRCAVVRVRSPSCGCSEAFRPGMPLRHPSPGVALRRRAITSARRRLSQLPLT